MADFVAVYEKDLVPILKKHDLEESRTFGRRTIEGIFSRLFEIQAAREVSAREDALQRDPAWRETLRRLASTFGDPRQDGHLRHRFGLYSTPAGAGRTVEAGPGFRRGSWHSFDVSDGLPSPLITSVLQDRKGFLWFGTEGGACRYDGESFVRFTTEDGLAHNWINRILEDRQGNLWFATGEFEVGIAGGGVSRYDGKCFETFTIEDGLAHNTVLSILQDRQNHLWFGTGFGGVSRYDGKCFETFTTEDGLAGNGVLSILEDREGNLWFGTGEHGFLGGGVSRYDGERFQTFTTKDGLAYDWVTTIAEDREGNLWFGNGYVWGEDKGKGVSRYDGERFQTFTTADGLAHDNVKSILLDGKGHLWFGTEGGVNQYDGREFTTFTIEDGLVHSWVNDLLEDGEGHLWFGTWAGVSRFDGQSLSTFTEESGLANNGVMCICEDGEDHLWFGTWAGVSRFDGEEFATIEEWAEDNVWVAAQDRKGHLWFASPRMGVSRYDGKSFLIYTTEDGLASNDVWDILQDEEGHLWFGTRGGGVSRYDGDTFATFTTEDGLASNWVTAIFQDRQGNLWFGHGEGEMSRYDGRHPVGKRFLTCTAEDGLASSGVKINSISEDSEGNLWFGYWGEGIRRYDGRVFQKLLGRDGLASNTVQQILQARSGDIWIATEGGLTRYRPSRIPPTVRIAEVIADRRYRSDEEIRLSASQKLLTFAFQGRSFTTPPDRLAYVCRLQDSDPDWRPVYTNRISYEKLPLGEYTFQVRAVDRDFNYSEPASVHLVVEPDPHLQALTEALNADGSGDGFVGESRALREVQTQIAQVASTELTAMILGETGTGKGLAARSIHALSPRHAGPFIQLNCGAIPEGLVESELFGHEKGAFTGAHERRLGRVEVAAGGTLFLDEIGDMSPGAQTRLLRLLEEGAFERVGGSRTFTADVRVVAATNRDLKQMIADGQFREDLYFRLRVFEVHLPPLRQRREDIPQLAAYFAERMASHLDKSVTHLEPAALELLSLHDWPGNVRELEHTIQRSVIVTPGPTIRPQDLGLDQETTDAETDELIPLEEHERRYLRQVLERTDGRISGPRGAAAILGIPESTLRFRMKKLGLKRP